MLHARNDYNRRIQDSENGIGAKEPVFIMRAQDNLMLPTLLHYLMLLSATACPDKVLKIAVVRHIDRVLTWQLENDTKDPDTPLRELSDNQGQPNIGAF